MSVAVSFGLASALSVVVLGDESGYTAGENQKMKIAAIEAMWETEPAPASFTIVGLPDQEGQQTRYAIHVPYVLGLIATRSIDKPVPGIKDLVADAEKRIRSGMIAYSALVKLRQDRNDTAARADFDQHVGDLGYALLLKRYTPAVTDATDQQIHDASWDTVPHVATLFWSFRLMVGLGFFFIALFASMFYLSCRRRLDRYPAMLWICLFSLPLPWLAAELGWYVAEGGRQPWTIDGVLPTFLSVSSVEAGTVWLSLSGFVLLYSALAVVELYLMIRTIRHGPQLPTAGSGDDPGRPRGRVGLAWPAAE
jgi:cytochrome d ubiquinol oxidase subunit I